MTKAANMERKMDDIDVFTEHINRQLRDTVDKRQRMTMQAQIQQAIYRCQMEFWGEPSGISVPPSYSQPVPNIQLCTRYNTPTAQVSSNTNYGPMLQNLPVHSNVRQSFQGYLGTTDQSQTTLTMTQPFQQTENIAHMTQRTNPTQALENSSIPGYNASRPTSNESADVALSDVLADSQNLMLQ